jgi:hypothetical protein
MVEAPLLSSRIITFLKSYTFFLANETPQQDFLRVFLLNSGLPRLISVEGPALRLLFVASLRGDSHDLHTMQEMVETN